MRSVRRPQSALGIAVALAVLLALPATAWCKQSSALAFHFAGSNGYRILAGGQGATGFIKVAQAGRPSRRSSASSTYITRARVSSTAIRASFGDLGSIAMRFHPSGRVTHSKPQRDCRGPDRYTTRLGVFVGSVRFRGEGGYTSATVHRAKGQVFTPPSLECAGPAVETGYREGHHGGDDQSVAKVTRLDAGWRSGLTAMYFRAATEQSRVRFLVASEQSEGPFAVYRTAYAIASPATFAFDDALSFASLTPPAPFSGSGSLQRNADGTRRWTGSLAISFPGDPDVPLTGPQFKTQLTRGW